MPPLDRTRQYFYLSLSEIFLVVLRILLTMNNRVVDGTKGGAIPHSKYFVLFITRFIVINKRRG